MTLIDMTNPMTSAVVVMLSQRASLGIEINTGMRNSRRSIMADVRSTDSIIPNAFVGDPAPRNWALGEHGFAVYIEATPETRYAYAHAAGSPVMVPLSGSGTKIGVWEDLDARIVMLGGPAGNSARLIRKGSTDKINAAAQRKHERRIAKLVALLGASA